MSEQALVAAAWHGPYPDRGDDPHEAADRRFWRALGTPFFAPARERARGDAVVAAARILQGRLAQLDAAALARRRERLRRRLALDGLTEAGTQAVLGLVAEAARRTLGLRPHAVQMLGAWAILQGRLAEMDTGEGKTLTIALAAAAAALARRRTHVITVNDYLVERDARELAPFYEALGLRVAAVTPELRDARARTAAWRADVVYCTNKTLVFDYLHDRLGMGERRGALWRELDCLAGAAPPLLAGLEFGIVDEADSVLVDECRTPLVLSRECAPPWPPEVFAQAFELAARLRARVDYTVLTVERRIEFTATGRAALRAAARGSFWQAARRREDLVGLALAAEHLFVRDEHYLVRDDTVQIIDPNTGRILPDRSWELGLQQMIETREGCRLSGTKQTLARMTYQRFFARYQRLGATTGTAQEVAGELWRVYGLRVLRIPRHQPSRRQALGLRLLRTSAEQQAAVLARVRSLHQQGRAVLLATRSVASSEALATRLAEAQLPHRVLNARHDAAEAAIVAQAGQSGQITVATNMAGRGTDIRLAAEVAAAGGLHVIAAECNDSRRLDRQLFGRAGRQGDPGSHETIVSLEDALLVEHLNGPLRRLAGRWLVDTSAGHSFPASLLLCLAQGRAERRAARLRARALREDRNLADALALSGTLE